jgi:thiamine-monophosphate kinase
MNEFQLIKHFFESEQESSLSESVVLGIGDDCALLQMPVGKQLAVSVDTLVADVHFPKDAPANLIAERALRTNLSDLAAMGAEPLWFTLALTLPQADEIWLREFSRGLFACAREFNIQLVGGDTTSGPLSVTIQVMGSIENKSAMRRDAANAEDFILVTNTLGDGAAALDALQKKILVSEADQLYLQERFYRPKPRLMEAKLICELANAALDISDGLVADLQHICERSDLGATIFVEDIPLSPALKHLQDQQQAYRYALTGGDDYELCFTVSPDNMPQIAMLIAEKKLSATVIGKMHLGSGVQCELEGEEFPLMQIGYQHFS